MKRHVLIAAAAAIMVQPMASLPVPVKQTGSDRVMTVVERMVPAGCEADARSARVGVWHPGPVLSGNRGGRGEARTRTARTHDRCVPRRECFTGRRPVGTKREPDSRFRTPTFLGK